MGRLGFKSKAKERSGEKAAKRSTKTEVRLDIKSV